MFLQHWSIDFVLKDFPTLVKVNLKDATCLGNLDGERFLAFVEGENALLGPAAACCLVESVLFQDTKDFSSETYRSH